MLNRQGANLKLLYHPDLVRLLHILLVDFSLTIVPIVSSSSFFSPDPGPSKCSMLSFLASASSYLFIKVPAPSSNPAKRGEPHDGHSPGESPLSYSHWPSTHPSFPISSEHHHLKSRSKAVSADPQPSTLYEQEQIRPRLLRPQRK